MKLGFTGTRKGMTLAQKRVVAEICDDLAYDTLHHGDCVGADEEAHHLASQASMERIEIWPPKEHDRRAYCWYQDQIKRPTIIVHEPDDFGARNRSIVDNTDGLVATPKGYQEELRSGTWGTIRYAMKIKRPVIVIWPDGTQETRK